MGSFRFLKNDLTGGQISPLLARRSNADRHIKGAASMQNMTIMIQGGATSRPGTQHVAEVKDSSKFTRLLPFEFNAVETYAIEAGDGYFRINKESGQVLETDIVVTGVTQANPGVITAVAHGLTTGDQFYLTEIVGMTELNHTRTYYTVGTTTANTLEIKDRDDVNIDTSGFTAYISGGVINKIFEVVSPYTEADLPTVQYTQSADVISLVHEDHAPRDLTRTSDTDWELVETDFINGPYLAENTEMSNSLTGSGPDNQPGDTITLTADFVTNINDGQGFVSTDVGRLVTNRSPVDIEDDTLVFWGTITSITSTTVVEVLVEGENAWNFTGGGSHRWRLGAWSDTTGYPRTVTYHQQRRFYAGTPTQPDTIWGSAIDDFTNFTPGIEDSDAVEYIIASNKVNAIYWLASSSRLRIGTEGGVHTLWGGSTTASLTPTNVEADQENKIKCKRIQPVDNGGITLFAQRSGKVMRELVFTAETDSLSAVDITLVSENILGNVGLTSDVGVKEMAFQLEPVPTMWCVKDDGNMAALTYSRETGTVGWHNHILGGTDVAVESVISIPGTGQDKIWVIVKRTINGVTRRYTEQLSQQFRGVTNREARFSDSFIHTSGETPAGTLTPSATTGTGVTFTAGSSVFASGDVGRVIQYNNTDSQGVLTRSRALITSFTSGTEVDATVLRDFPDTSIISSGNWTLSNNVCGKLDHLEGEQVSILVDGGTHPAQTVTNGSVTLNGQYTDITIGFGYVQEIELVDIDFGSAVGTAYGGRSKVNEIFLELFETMGMFIGFDEDTLREVVFREGNDTMNEGVPLFTGTKTPRPKGGWRDTIKTLIRQVDPLPLTVLAIVIKGTVSDETG